jgi:hypothetical protein
LVFSGNNGGSPLLAWNLRNPQGAPVASGLYLYVIKSDQGERRGKIALLR